MSKRAYEPLPTEEVREGDVPGVIFGLAVVLLGLAGLVWVLV